MAAVSGPGAPPGRVDAELMRTSLPNGRTGFGSGSWFQAVHPKCYPPV